MRLSGRMIAEHIYAEFQPWQASALLWEVLGRFPLATPTSRCPSPPGGQRGTQTVPPVAFPPPSAARLESQARGGSARRLRDMNDWRSGPGWGGALLSLPPDHGAVQGLRRLCQYRVMDCRDDRAAAGGANGCAGARRLTQIGTAHTACSALPCLRRQSR